MFLICSLLITAALANANDLVGTWTTKSRDVLTGPVCGTTGCSIQMMKLTRIGILRSAQRQATRAESNGHFILI